MSATHVATAAALDTRQAHHDTDEGSRQASLGLMLSTGGDSRIWIDPYTGRNRYGVRTRPSPAEIAFASTTASTIRASGFARAGRAFRALLGSGRTATLSPEQWLSALRAQIATALGTPETHIILAASGTDAELIALALAAGASARALTNIVMAPAETGSGVPLAASGRHFLASTALGAEVTAGEPITAMAAESIDVAAIAIRNGDGTARTAAAIDQDAAEAVARALRQDRDVLLHVLDTSKTGLTGLTRATARQLRDLAPQRVRVVVDACQLRCRPAQIRQDLDDGFMVIATGSKLAGGPPFSGALLLPASLAGEFAAGRPLPSGLADYSAALDWPDHLRDRLGQHLTSAMNIGLGLRWEAALDGIMAMAGVGDRLQDDILRHFGAAVRARAADLRCIGPLAEDAGTIGPSSIIPLVVLRSDGRLADTKHAQRVHEALRDEDRGRICHIGQTVVLGECNVLRVAASAADVAGIARRLSEGAGLDSAFRPVADDLDVLFAKWAHVTRDLA